MFDESGFFDPNTMVGSLLDHGLPAETCSSNNNNNNCSSSSLVDDKLKQHAGFSLEELPNEHIGGAPSDVGLEHLPHHLGFDLEQDLHGHLLMQEAAVAVDNAWMINSNLHEGDAHNHPDLHLPLYATAAAAPDLLNLLHLPRCGVAAAPPASALPFSSPGRRAASFPVAPFGGELQGSEGVLDASVQLGYPGPPTNLLRDLFHSLPQNYGLFYGAGHEREALAGAADHVGAGGMVGGGAMVFGEEGDGRQFEVDGGVFEFRVEGKVHTTEKQRREQLGEKFKLLKSLVPNPTKNDRATTISDAINYINELKRTIEELKILVDTKKHGWNKKQKLEDSNPPPAAAAAVDMESSSMTPLAADGSSSSSLLRSSWIQRKTKETSLDVRIVDDEVTIKVSRRKKGSCLLTASRAIEELQLELIHVAGGHIGDCYVFLFNTKVHG
ncbi:hypothetical protein Taro_024599 [Colocasia esculenta]|uniref:BHLH domain-containing protein n=1 Tax=Colocasia esculenta TaxID=4460 RepID=A0A843V0S4_COLES|nr:hypothetical protein [Colocasia esculenta]